MLLFVKKYNVRLMTRVSNQWSPIVSGEKQVERSLSNRTSITLTKPMSKSHEWAKMNKEIANKCLSPPAIDNENDELAVSYLNNSNLHSKETNESRSSGSLEGYLRHRKWHIEETSKPHAVNLVSHVLSFPLTLAHYGGPILCKNNNKVVRIGCIGARSESTLPHQYWKEIVHYSSYFSSLQEIRIDFVGLDVIESQKEKVNNDTMISCKQSNGDTNIYLSSHRGILEHHHIEKYKWDLLVLFNPGLNHHNLYNSWKESWDIMKKSNIPILLTAHSYIDAKRDSQIVFDSSRSKQTNHLLEKENENKYSYDLNVFGSRMEFTDPFNKTHIVQPNLYVTSVV